MVGLSGRSGSGRQLLYQHRSAASQEQENSGVNRGVHRLACNEARKTTRPGDIAKELVDSGLTRFGKELLGQFAGTFRKRFPDGLRQFDIGVRTKPRSQNQPT